MYTCTLYTCTTLHAPMPSCIISVELPHKLVWSKPVHADQLWFSLLAPSLAVLKIGSMEVGALLNDAFKEYQVGFDKVMVD